MNLRDVRFPIYPIREVERIVHEGPVVLIETVAAIYILDDTSLSGDLAARRLQIKEALETSPYKLYPLTHMVEDWGQVFFKKAKFKKYIDSDGKIFNYKPSKRYKLQYRKVVGQKILEYKHTLVFLEGIPSPFKVKRPLPSGTLYCGIVETPLGRYILDFSFTKKPDTNRKL